MPDISLAISWLYQARKASGSPCRIPDQRQTQHEPHPIQTQSSRFPSKNETSTSMPPCRALPGALQPLSTPSCLHRLPRPTLNHTAPTRSPISQQSRTLSSAHPATSTDTEHPAPHSDHYDPPSGWLFNVPPGEKYKKEGWENVWIWGFWGSIGLAVVGYAYKPDTS